MKRHIRGLAIASSILLSGLGRPCSILRTIPIPRFPAHPYSCMPWHGESITLCCAKRTIVQSSSAVGAVW